MKRALLLPLLATLAHAAPEIIDDVALRSGFEKKLGAIADQEEHPTAKALSESLESIPTGTALPAGAELTDEAPESPADAVFLIGGVYKCGKCEHWHLSSVATAWALSRDGLMVTNHHVFENARGKAMGVCDRHGTVHPITEVLAADPDADTALFRVAADGLTPLPVGPTPEVGTEVEVVSHPHNRFFMHTFGRVARYFTMPQRDDRPSVTRMSITADYAKGSSGGPVLDTEGRVVGMVSSTQSIYYESNNGQPKGPLQMVVKNCVPVAAIEALVAAAEPEEATAGQR